MSKAQNMNIEWRYSRAIFDSNQWHEISEARVDWLFKTPFSSNLHSLDDADATIEIKGLRPQRWQMLPVDGVEGRYVMRSNYTGPQLQIATCYKEDEADDSKTGICLHPATGEDSQKWDIDFVETTGSTYVFRNVANSTDFVLDCHPGNPIFMNKNFDPANNPAQHWILRPDGEINDESYSTTYTQLPAGATNKPLPADTGDSNSATPRGTTRGADGSSPTDTSSGSDGVSGDNGSSQLSAGAVAGIGIGAALGVIMLASLIFAFLWRRRKTNQPLFARGGGKMSEMDGSTGGDPPSTNPNGNGNGNVNGNGNGNHMVQMWHAKSPQSDHSMLSNMPPGGYNNMAGIAAYNANGQVQYIPQQHQQQQQHQMQMHTASPAHMENPYNAPPTHYPHNQIPQQPPMTLSNGTWSDSKQTSPSTHPDGQMTWPNNDSATIGLDRRPSDMQNGPAEAMDTSVKTSELDSTPVAGRDNHLQSIYARYE